MRNDDLAFLILMGMFFGIPLFGAFIVMPICATIFEIKRKKDEK